MLIEWNDELSINDDIDSDHKFLINLINTLHLSITGASDKSVEDVLIELSEYTVYHFSKEEFFMSRIRYPEYDDHKIQHQLLIDQLTKVVYNYEMNKISITSDTMDFLKYWLTNHILTYDKKIVKYMKEN